MRSIFRRYQGDWSTPQKRRVLWFTIHFWLGWVPGLVFSLIGLTGSLLVFWPELDVWMNPELRTVDSQMAGENDVRSLDDIVAAAESVIPPDGTPYALVFPRFPDTTFAVTYGRPAPNPEQQEWHEIFVNPYTAHVQGQRLMLDLDRPWRGSFWKFIFCLHYTLAFGEKGATFVGLLALVLPVLLGTGLILWWPTRGSVNYAFAITQKVSRHRRVYDLHRTLGLYSSGLLLISVVTGLYLVFPDQAKKLIGVVSPTTPISEDLASIQVAGKRPIGFSAAAAIAERHFPDGRYQWIFFPQGADGLYRIVKKAPSERTDILPARTLWIDQYSGRIIHDYHPQHYTAGDTLERWLFPLHSGEAFGIGSRILIVILGLIPGALFITGILRWAKKRRR